MIELIKLQFHGLRNNAERISLRSSPRSPQVCFLFRTGEPNTSARNKKTGKAGNFQFWEWFSNISDFGITYPSLLGLPDLLTTYIFIYTRGAALAMLASNVPRKITARASRLAGAPRRQ